MSLARPGSLPWLLRRELRIAWREAAFFAARGRSLRRPLLIAAVLQLAALPVGWAVASAATPPLPVALLIVSAVLAITWAGMLAQSLVTATRTLFLRGDLDLLLSAPIPARSVLTVRALSVAATAITSWSLLAMLTINALVLFGQFRWLLLYPVYVALALAAAAAALGLAMGLFALLGARRMRIAAQVIAATLGIAIVLLFQLPGFILGSAADVAAALFPLVVASVERGDVLWWPARAVLGEPVQLAALLAASLAMLAAVVVILGPRFAMQARAALGAERTRTARTGRETRFRSGAGATLRRKEWRLLRRDPWLLSQVGLPAVYMLPLAVLSWISPHGVGLSVPAAIFVLVMTAGGVASGLAWVTMAGEDAPELLACAPVQPRTAAVAKLHAAVLPVAAMLAIPVAILSWHAPQAGAAALAGCGGAMATAALLQLWHPQAGDRRRFSYRHRASVLRGLVELAANLAWALAAATTVAAPDLSPYLWAGAALIVPLLHALRARRAGG